MMTDAEWAALKAKIDKEFLIRLKLADLAGRPKINPKNYKACEEFDATIPELFLEVAQNKPENIEAALQLIKG
jgi:hypothetical protein